jgi:aminocarboxymuconate-semialdehyde decarboxylase
MRNPKTVASEVNSKARRDVLKLFGGSSVLSMLNAYAADPVAEAAALPLPAQESMYAAAKDAETVIWEARQSQRPPISVDVHCHWSPPAYSNLLKEDAGRGGTTRSLAAELANNIKWMDERSVQTCIWTLGGGKPWHWLSPAEAARAVTLINDAGFEAHKMYPDRMFLGAEIPAFDPALSLKEVNRVAGNPAVKGIALPTSMIHKDYVFEPAFEPVLARCAELGYPLLFHPLDGEVHEYGGTQSRIGQPLTEDTFIYNTLGFPWDTATVGSLFIVTGILDRYPKLQVVLPHAGGVFPYVAGRVQHGIERRKFPLKRPFREYWKQFYFDTMTYYPETMRFLIDLVGYDHILVGTDSSYNASALDHSGGGGRQGRYEWPNTLVEMMKLPKDQEEAILRGNAVKLFKL